MQTAACWTLALLSLATLGDRARAEDDITIGAELTHTNSMLAESDSHPFWQLINRDKKVIAAQKEVVAYLKEYCARTKSCRVRRTLRKWFLAWDYEVVFFDGPSFRISTDGPDVESQLQPLTIAEQKRYRNLHRNTLEKALRSAALEPTLYAGGIHLHVGVRSAFQGNPVRFRNYLVDAYNHRSIGVMDFSADLDQFPLNFQAIISAFDSGRAWNGRRLLSIEDLAQAVENDIYDMIRTAEPADSSSLFDRNGFNLKLRPKKLERYMRLKNVAINLTRIHRYRHEPEKQTIELRNVYAPATIYNVLALSRIVAARIHYLNSLNGLVALDFGHKRRYSSYSYVTETSLKWSQVSRLWPASHPLKKGDPLLLYPHTWITRRLDREQVDRPSCMRRFMSKAVTLNHFHVGY